ncbi:hypothetical protein ACFORG_09240 [Lutimaribacter marinistellae]|uniref:Tripartite ATP-independent transporter, DctQ component n=1 Tax=Lutimaribacter marinistellae TaxID=1820329 RepID=A0ABV7TGU2_9RHOB
MAGKIGKVLARELREMLPPTLFFLGSLNILVLTVGILSDDHVPSTVSQVSATIGALLIGKTFLLADKIPLMAQLDRRPLLTASLSAAGLYYVIATVLHIAERLISAATDSRGFLFRAKAELAAFDLPLFLVVQLWLAFLLVVYALAARTLRRLGRENVRRHLLQPVEGPPGST